MNTTEASNSDPPLGLSLNELLGCTETLVCSHDDDHEHATNVPPERATR